MNKGTSVLGRGS